MCAGQVSGYDAIANGASTALLNLTATGAGFGSVTRCVETFFDVQILGIASSRARSMDAKCRMHTAVRQAEDSAPHFYGSRKLLAAGDFLAVTSGAADWVNVTAVTLGDLEFSFDADDGTGVAKGYVFLNGTAEPLAAGNGGGQRVAGGAPGAASTVSLMHLSPYQGLDGKLGGSESQQA